MIPDVEQKHIYLFPALNLSGQLQMRTESLQAPQRMGRTENQVPVENLDQDELRVHVNLHPTGADINKLISQKQIILNKMVAIFCNTNPLHLNLENALMSEVHLQFRHP